MRMPSSHTARRYAPGRNPRRERAIKLLALGALASAWASSGCKSRSYNETEVKAARPADAPPGLGESGERKEPDEERSIARMAELTVELQKIIRERQGKPGDPLRRDAHTKAHGCARAVFEVDPALPEEFRFGVFQPGVRYPAWVRLSNGAPGVTPDTQPSSRGFAVKLLDVDARLSGRDLPAAERAWLLPDRTGAGQDFTFLNHPRFIAKDLKTYIAFSEGLSTEKPLSGFVSLDPAHPRFKPIQAKTLLETVLMPVSNPVGIPYFGQVPYKFRDTAVKYRIDPCGGAAKQERAKKDASGDFLHDAFRDALAAGDVCYDFSLIVQKDPVAQPIEDSNVEWLSDEADVRAGRKFANRTRVARLVIPSQPLPAPATDARCEAMSFNPWHSLAAHKPLGSMGRARLAIYLAGAAARPARIVGESPDAQHEALLARASAFPAAGKELP